MSKLHFVGVAGSGMSALAQFHVMKGGAATGSDRAFDQNAAPELREKLQQLGIRLFPQDGSALEAKPEEVIYSTAVEDSIPDLQCAKERGVPTLARADLLARHVEAFKTIAVAGTSGKSTVVAMIFEILESAGLAPSVITGGALRSLASRGLVGNAFGGKSDWLVVEADESDGTLVRYKPWLGVLLNISKDHKEIAELNSLFGAFAGRSRERVVGADSPEFAPYLDGASTFGFESGALRPANLRLEADTCSFDVGKVAFRLPMPGRHNVENALAAIAASANAGVSLDKSARALADYRGVARRFERVGSERGVEVIDDFAHNPAKVAATLEAAHLRAKRVHAVFQLHGFAPAKFMRAEFVDAFARGLRESDTLWLPEIYYAGGTAHKTISARDIADEIRARGRDARFFPTRDAIIPQLSGIASAGDLVLVMGARDPGLPAFARAVLRGLETTARAVDSVRPKRQ